VKSLRYGLISLILVLAAFLWGPALLKGRAGLGNDDMVPVVVADQYIPAFSIVKEKMATVQYYPKGYVPPGALHAIHDMHGDGDRDLYITAVAVPEGQPLTHTVLEELGKSRGMASVLSLGKVAVSFAADPVRGAGGWVEPGNVIALFHTTLETERGKSFHKTRLLFSSLSVLAVDKNRLGQEASPAPANEIPPGYEGGGSVITVLANPLEASRLIEAREQGHLSVALRSLGDDTPWAGL
jgi:Flp pilus assembly protein CpaB